MIGRCASFESFALSFDFNVSDAVDEANTASTFIGDEVTKSMIFGKMGTAFDFAATAIGIIGFGVAAIIGFGVFNFPKLALPMPVPVPGIIVFALSGVSVIFDGTFPILWDTFTILPSFVANGL